MFFFLGIMFLALVAIVFATAALSGQPVVQAVFCIVMMSLFAASLVTMVNYQSTKTCLSMYENTVNTPC